MTRAALISLRPIGSCIPVEEVSRPNPNPTDQDHGLTGLTTHGDLRQGKVSFDSSLAARAARTVRTPSPWNETAP